MKGKKWFYFLIIAAAVAAGAVRGESVKAEETDSLAISEKNFPDKNIQEILAKKFDKNKDQALSKEELRAVRELDLLNLGEIDIINIQGISKLKYVDSLAIDIDYIENLGEIKKMPQLTELYINSTVGRHIDLRKNVNLLELNLNMPLRKLDLKNNKKLQKLSLDSSCLGNITVKDFSDLQRIYITWGSCSRVTIRNCPRLVKAVIGSSELKEIRLKKVPNLEILKVGGTKKMKTLTIPSFPKLRELKIGSVKNMKILKLPTLRNLKYLTIGKNQIKKLNLKRTPNLEELIVDRAEKITEIDIRPLKKLRELKWQNGRLKRIRFGQKKKLKYMYLSHNQLGGIWKLSRFPKLREFSCNYNRIECIYGRNHRNLDSLECEHNKLRKLDLYNIEPFIIWFKGNPHVEAYLIYRSGHAVYYRFDKTAKVHYKENR